MFKNTPDILHDTLPVAWRNFSGIKEKGCTKCNMFPFIVIFQAFRGQILKYNYRVKWWLFKKLSRTLTTYVRLKKFCIAEGNVYQMSLTRH